MAVADIPGIPDSLRDALSRGVVLPETFYGDTIGHIRAASATVSGLASLDQVQAVIDSLRRAMEGGQTFAEWKRALLASGYDYGLPAWRMETIFRTNLQSWYAAGRAESIRRNQNAFPYLRYSAILDARVRPSHARLHGLILPVDHPFWKSHYPPSAYNCRCQVIPMTERAARSAIAKARDAGKVIDEVPAGVEAPDAGWDYDRLRAGAPLEGLERAVARKAAICVPEQYAARSSSDALWCHGPGAEALDMARTALRVDEDMPPPRRLPESLDLPQGMRPDAYVAEFMREFGAGAKDTVLWRSVRPAITLAVNAGIFEKQSGVSKLAKRGRQTHVRYIAQGIRDPDEVWYVKDSGGTEKLYYLARMQVGNERADTLAVFRWDGRGWEPDTGYRADQNHYLGGVRAKLQHAGVLLYRRR